MIDRYDFLYSLTFRLFEEHSELILLFEKFRELKTREEQAQSEELAEHANKVMETLDEGIRSLDELDVFFQYLHDVGASHTRIPGFTPDHFWVS
jgi:neuroglobin